MVGRPNDWSVSMAQEFAEALGCVLAELPPVLHAVLLEGKTTMPMQIGVRERMLERYPRCDANKLVRALRRYTGSFIYLGAVRDKRDRCDLDGKPVGRMDPAHAGRAQNLFYMKQRRQKRERREAEAS